MLQLLSVLRLFLPSWKFFDEYGSRPLLSCRLQEASGLWGDWMPVGTKNRRVFFNLFVNSSHNLELALFSILEQFVDDPKSEGVLFELLVNRVEAFVLEKTPGDPQKKFEFRVELLDLDTRHLELLYP